MYGSAVLHCASYGTDRPQWRYESMIRIARVVALFTSLVGATSAAGCMRDAEAAASSPRSSVVQMAGKHPFGGREDGLGYDLDNRGPGLVTNGEMDYMFPSSLYAGGFWDFLGFVVINDLSDADDVDTSGPWQSEDTATAGCPAMKGDYDNGAIELLLDNGNEVGDCAINWGDELSIDSDTEPFCIFRIQYQTAPAAADSLVWGLGSAQNDLYASVTAFAAFSVAGADNNLDAQSDDNSTDVNATDTTIDMTAGTFIETMISMNSMHGRTSDDADGASPTDVHFFYRTTTGGAWTQVLPNTTFSVGADVALQPFVQVEKTSGTTTPDLLVDYISCYWQRE